MNTFKTITAFGAALVLATTMGSAFAEDADQTRSQDRVRQQLNLQTPDASQAQDRLRVQSMDRLHEADGEGQGDGEQAQKMQQKKQQPRNEYQYRENSGSRQPGMGAGNMARPGR